MGTTNKTHYSDYKEAITEETKALLKVHTVTIELLDLRTQWGIDELIPLAKEHDLSGD